MLGLSFARAFADPFADPTAADAAALGMKRYADLVMGPLLLGFVSWLTVRLRDDRADGVLFAARDGYLPLELYQAVDRKFPEWTLPAGQYFQTNRRAAFLPNAAESGSVEAILRLVGHLGLSLPPAELLQAFFDLPPETMLGRESEPETLPDLLAIHRTDITRQAKKARMAYYRYMEKLGLRMGGCYAFVEFVATGTCQMYLERFVPFALKGLYCGRTAFDMGYDIEVTSYLRGEYPELLEHYLELESYITSPEPSLQGFDREGEPYLAEELRSREMMTCLAQVHAEVRDYLHTFLRLFWWEREAIDPALPERMFAANGAGTIYRENYDDWAKCRL